jgi:hypothetical protein
MLCGRCSYYLKPCPLSEMHPVKRQGFVKVGGRVTDIARVPEITRAAVDLTERLCYTHRTGRWLLTITR